jgi:hypothetical protein
MLKTHPMHPFDWMLWPLLKIVWERVLGSRKTSHFWHWRKTILMPAETLVLQGDESALSVRGRLSNFLGTNFLWQKVAILEAQTDEPFQIGICTQSDRGGKGTKLLCSVILPKGRHFGMLIGVEPVGFYARTEYSQNFVPLKVVGEATRKTLSSEIPLL